MTMALASALPAGLPWGSALAQGAAGSPAFPAPSSTLPAPSSGAADAALQRSPVWGPQHRLEAEPVWAVSSIPAGLMPVPQDKLLTLRYGMSLEAVRALLGEAHSIVRSPGEAGEVWQYVARDYAGNKAFIASLWFGSRGLWLATGRSRPVGKLAEMPFGAPPLAQAGGAQAPSAGKVEANAVAQAAAPSASAPAGVATPVPVTAAAPVPAAAALPAQSAPSVGTAPSGAAASAANAPAPASNAGGAAPAASVAVSAAAPKPAGSTLAAAPAEPQSAPAAMAAPAASAVTLASVPSAAAPASGMAATPASSSPPTETPALAPLVVQPAPQFAVPSAVVAQAGAVPPAAATPAPAVPAASAGSASTAPAASVASPSAAPAASAPAPDQTLALRDAIDTWLAAWSRQDVVAYLAAYTPAYVPPGRKRAEWERERRERLKQPVFIRVHAEEVKVQEAAGARPRVSFLQRYESERYEEKSRKVLTFVKQNGRWLIEKEENVRLR